MKAAIRIEALCGVGLLLVLSSCTRTPAPQRGGEPSAQEQQGDTVGGADAQGSARGGGMMGGRGMMGRRGMMAGMMGQPADTSAAPTANAAQASAPGCPDVSQTLVDAGRKTFTGGDGGTCFACHGSDAHGTPTGPNLADETWLNVDGSYAAIDSLITAGVPHPKQFPAPMPAMGGAQLSGSQICSLAAYVYSLSH